MSEPPSASSEGVQSDDWRSQVAQSYRNTEVREISKVLAALEPGASAGSKLRLAMQFEDAVFKSATSLADYRKRLTKRLKKVQKSYVPTNDAAKNNKEKQILELRQQHGPNLRYIVKHAAQAVAEMRAKHGEEKASQLKQHTDGVKLWARDLGVLENTQANMSMSEEHLTKLKDHLDRRMENIRQHVSKLADPDRFISESLEKVEEELQGPASQVLAKETCKFYEKLTKGFDQKPGGFDPNTMLQESLERAQVPVPLPTRNQRNDERAALIHLDKMRAASSVFLAYMAVSDKSTVPRHSLTKAQAIATEGIDFVTTVMRNHRKDQKEPEVSLEDAWLKSLELPVPAVVEDASTSSTEPSPGKKPRLSSQGPVLRSKVLLTAGRKAPSNLLPAFKRKRATLVRPPPQGQGSHLILEFGTAFVMKIYFVPLLVTLRAYKKPQESAFDDDDNLQCASWTPLCHGLPEGDNLSVWGATGNYEQIGSLVEERLRDASAHATQVLRQCFATAAKDNVGDFEVEILEATALLEFLHLARSTYIPNWQDDDT